MQVNLNRNAHGHLVLIEADGRAHEVTPVRSFPILAPDEGISLVGNDGHERLWVEQLGALPQAARQLIEEALAPREFTPAITRIERVSSFSTPSTWSVQTDRGAAQLVLKGEEDIRKLGSRTQLLIASASGVQYRIPDSGTLDKPSRKLLERFL